MSSAWCCHLVNNSEVALVCVLQCVNKNNKFSYIVTSRSQYHIKSPFGFRLNTTLGIIAHITSDRYN